MSRYFVKPMYLKRPERLTNWTGGSYIFVHHTKDLKSATSICSVSKKNSSSKTIMIHAYTNASYLYLEIDEI